MHFELTFDNGGKHYITTNTWADVLKHVSRPEELVRVEQLFKDDIRTRIKQVNQALHILGQRYGTGSVIRDYIADLLLVNGFEVPSKWDSTFTNQEGAMRNVPIGEGVYLTVTWYKMASGNYEVVAYVS